MSGEVVFVIIAVVIVLVGAFIGEMYRISRERQREILRVGLEQWVNDARNYILVLPVVTPLPFDWVFTPRNHFSRDLAYIRKGTQVWTLYRRAKKWRAVLIHSEARIPPVGEKHVYMQPEWNGVELDADEEHIRSWERGDMPSPVFADALEDTGMDATHPFLYALRSVSTWKDNGSSSDPGTDAGGSSSGGRINGSSDTGQDDGNSSTGPCEDTTGDGTALRGSPPTTHQLQNEWGWWTSWDESSKVGWTEFTTRQVSDDDSPPSGPDVPPNS